MVSLQVTLTEAKEQIIRPDTDDTWDERLQGQIMTSLRRLEALSMKRDVLQLNTCIILMSM